MADRIDILVPKESIDSILAADKAITQLDIVYRRLTDNIAAGQKAIKEAAISQESLSNAGKKAKETSEELDSASKKLLATEKALNEFDAKKYKQIVENEQALKDQKKAILEAVQAEKQLTGTIEKAEASTKALTAERKKLNLETTDGKKRLLEINAAIDKNTAVIRENSDVATKQRMNIGNYRSALDGLPGPLGQVASSAQTAATGLKAVTKVPIVAAVAAIIGVFVGLFKAFKSTEEGGDRVAKIMGRLKGVLDVLKQAAQSVSLALADLLSGKFGQAADHLRDGFSGIGKRMSEAAKAGGQLAETLDNIADEKLAYNIDAVRAKIAELRTEAAEATDPAERAAKLREAIALTQELYGKQIDWSKRAADAEIQNVTAKFKVSADEFKKFLLTDQAGREEMIAGNQELAFVQNSLNNEGLADLRDKLTEETRLQKEFLMESLRGRRFAASAEQQTAREAQSAAKQAFEARVKMIEEESAVIAQMAEEDKQTRANKEAEASSLLSAERDRQLATLSDQYNRGAMETEDYEAERLRITRKYEALILQEQLNSINRLITESNLSTTQKAEMEAKGAAIQLQINTLLTDEKIANIKAAEDAEKESIKNIEDAKKEAAKKQEEADKAAAERKKAIQEAEFDLATELGNAIFEINNNRIEAEISDIERRRDAAIQAAGDDKEAQTKINAKFDKELAAQKTKQAKNDRNAALFNIAINTAIAATKGLSEGGPLLMALYIALGAIQAGVVLSKEIPKFAKGTAGQFNTPSTFLAGEAGTEWVESQSGQIKEVNRPTVFTNSKGMRVYSNRELSDLQRYRGESSDTSELRALRAGQDRGFDKLARSLAEQKQYLFHNGRAYGYKKGNHKVTYIERMVGNA